MSAVPKRKLCWNCEGNVSKEVDNCPYCGVYLLGAEVDDDSLWRPNHRPSPKLEESPHEESPPPLYEIHSRFEREEARIEPQATDSFRPKAEEKVSLSGSHLLYQLKQEVFPTLFLMMGSIFFLFGFVLLLFSHNGTLTLQWNESDGFYFFIAAFPLIALGWRYFQQIDES